MQKQEVCTVSSIVLLLTLIGHNMFYIYNSLVNFIESNLERSWSSKGCSARVIVRPHVAHANYKTQHVKKKFNHPQNKWPTQKHKKETFFPKWPYLELGSIIIIIDLFVYALHPIL